ncbi:cell envelope integrity/translocation protein TolA [Methylocapsa acidiphila]|uniref:cell envelope integrity/translocation protein TolA n=1 Tax=Methylocapsa acidiphila TaxID=133552 RepID=UPI0003FBF4A0|nr:cell envelope integrity/translocation protein TolA [Methylocapsa acidiphila]
MSLREKPGLALSGCIHLLLLAALLLSFSRPSGFEDAQETIPVDMISAQDFNQIMKGEKTAKQIKPSPRAEKRAEIAELKPQPAQVDAKQEIPTPPSPLKRQPDPGREEAKETPKPPDHSASVQPPPRPVEEPQKPAPAKSPPAASQEKPPPDERAEAVDPKPVPRPKVEPEPKPDTASEAKAKPVEKPKPLFKPDQVAKLLNQEKAKETPEKPVQKPAARPKSGDEAPETTQKFDPGDISRLLSKDAPQHKQSTGRELQQVASLGSPTASAAKMSPSLWGMLDGLLQEQYKRCWNYIGVAGQKKYVPEIHVQYAQDGSLIGQPSLLNPPSDPNLRSLAESALRAVRRCDPLHIPAQYQPYYDQWKGRIVRFDPEDML